MDFELLLKYDKKIEEVNNILKKLKEKRDSIESELIHKYKNVEAPIKVNNMIITMQKLRMHVLGSVELSATENIPAFVPSVLVMFAVLLTRLLT